MLGWVLYFLGQHGCLIVCTFALTKFHMYTQVEEDDVPLSHVFRLRPSIAVHAEVEHGKEEEHCDTSP